VLLKKPLKLYKKIEKYITESKKFSPQLAIEVANFQLKNNDFYKQYAKKKRINKIKKIEDIPFLPVEFFKKYKIFSFKTPDNYFLSSGTGGNRSKVFYNQNSLNLYRLSAIKSFPFKNIKIYSLIPDFSFASNSSLSFMIRIFYESFDLQYINKKSFIINAKKIIDILKNQIYENSVIFLTSIQLLNIVSKLKEPIYKKFTFIETGGYKATKKVYNRKQLYALSKNNFPESEFFSEYGMAELFSQFYSISKNKNYLFSHYNYILSKDEETLVKVFDFANLGTVSALLIPDKIVKKNNEFDVKGRITSEIRGCGYVFR